MPYTPKTNWAYNEVVTETDLNRIEQGVADANNAVDAMDAKNAVRAASTANIASLSGPQTIDGVSLITGDRVLLKNQSIASQNGLWVVAAATWGRATDADTGSEANTGMTVRVMEGTVNTGSEWQLTTTGAITIGSTNLSFAQVSGSPDLSTLEYSNGKVQLKDGGTTDAKIGNRTITDTLTAASGADTPTNLFSKLGNMIKQITGKSTWYTSPVTTIEALNTAMATKLPSNNAVVTGSFTLAQDAASAMQAVTKQQLDAYVLGLDTKQSCRAVSTTDITLSGAQTVDGVSLIAGDRILVTGQSTGANNGIYVVAAGAWARATDADTSAKVTSGMYTFISSGTVNGGNGFSLLTADPLTLGTTALVFTLFNGPGSVTVGTGLQESGNVISITNGGVTDTLIGTRTINDSTAQTAGAAALPTTLWSQIGNMIKGITGKSNWYTLPVISLEGLNTTTPKVSTADVTYYVRTDGSDSNTGLSNTSGGAFLTIAKAISMVPQVVNHAFTINVAAGTYAEAIFIQGKIGFGSILIQGDTVVSTSRSVTSIGAYNTSVYARVVGFNLTVATLAINVLNCARLELTKIKIAEAALGANGIVVESSKIYIGASEISNRGTAIFAHINAEIVSDTNTGTGNSGACIAQYGGEIKLIGTQPNGTQTANQGGIIIPAIGVLNPWGDNTQLNRSAISYVNSTTQAISGATATKILFPTGGLDNLGEGGSSKFTAKQAGIYNINAIIQLSGLTSGSTTITIMTYKNGSNVGHTPLTALANATTAGYSITDTFLLAVGDYLEIYITTSTTSTIATISIFNVTRIA